MFYYQLGNLSPKFKSSLSSIYLISIAKSSVIQKYGPDKILEPFMADIKDLEKVRSNIALNFTYCLTTGRSFNLAQICSHLEEQ